MTAVIIMLEEWLLAHRRPELRSPTAMDVALDHIAWLLRTYPGVHPRTAALMLGVELEAYSWARVIEAYAAAWEALPEDIRRVRPGD